MVYDVELNTLSNNVGLGIWQNMGRAGFHPECTKGLEKYNDEKLCLKNEVKHFLINRENSLHTLKSYFFISVIYKIL